ncbi:DUF934 domain-containing protein [Tsuneonella amylolytica]|uniref:DUF934 domain-containing protein n=1 Tax=Tsuneonella amylolytica TaxID=2338327 RepID=UPI000EA89251|nr:DUF934 domain-containing protein [Tsuneonella amylolytica]
MPIVTPEGFRPADAPDFVPAGELPSGSGLAVDLPNDADAEILAARFADIALVRIPFPVYGDGRGFSLARQLREMGYRGRLRASGYVISDQFRHALQCGFDEVEIDDALAARQPEPDWQLHDWPSYREKLAGEVIDATGAAVGASAG